MGSRLVRKGEPVSLLPDNNTKEKFRVALFLGNDPGPAVSYQRRRIAVLHANAEPAVTSL